MGAFTAGDVVLVRFPFSDLSQTKLRPAIVLADAGRGDLVLCQVTSRPYGDAAAEPLAPADWHEFRLAERARVPVPKAVAARTR